MLVDIFTVSFCNLFSMLFNVTKLNVMGTNDSDPRWPRGSPDHITVTVVPNARSCPAAVVCLRMRGTVDPIYGNYSEHS